MIVASLTLVSILHVFSVVCLWRSRRRNPAFLFVAFNWFFSIGTIANFDPRVEADRVHSFLIAFAAVGVSLYSMIFFNHRRYSNTERAFSRRMAGAPIEFNRRAAWLLFGVSIGVSFVYYRFLVGYNLFLPALAGADLDFTTMRLAAYAGENYTGAGIVNQFKNTILPITFFCLMAAYGSARRWFAFSIFLAVTAPIFLWAILGTGQRTFLFFAIAGALYSFSVQGKRIPPIALVAISVTFVVFFGVFSVALGRTSDANFMGVMSEVGHRLLNANQAGAVSGFRYVYEKEVTNGVEWLQTLVGYLPGVRGSTLSSEVSNYVFGGFRGSVPVSLWVSVYYNLGMAGVVPAAILIMKIVESAHLVLRFIPMTRLHLVAYSYLCFYFGIMPATPPLQILNNGLLAIILVFLIAGFHIRKSTISFGFV